jgi:hypothetical protein
VSTNSLVIKDEGSTLLMPKVAIGNDIESGQSCSHCHKEF